MVECISVIEHLDDMPMALVLKKNCILLTGQDTVTVLGNWSQRDQEF